MQITSQTFPQYGGNTAGFSLDYNENREYAATSLHFQSRVVTHKKEMNMENKQKIYIYI